MRYFFVSIVVGCAIINMLAQNVGAIEIAGGNAEGVLVASAQ